MGISVHTQAQAFDAILLYSTQEQAKPAYNPLFFIIVADRSSAKWI